MGHLKDKSVFEVSLRIYNFNETDDLILKAAELIEDGYTVFTANSNPAHLRFSDETPENPILELILRKDLRWNNG